MLCGFPLGRSVFREEFLTSASSVKRPDRVSRKTRLAFNPEVRWWSNARCGEERKGCLLKSMGYRDTFIQVATNCQETCGVVPVARGDREVGPPDSV